MPNACRGSVEEAAVLLGSDQNSLAPADLTLLETLAPRAERAVKKYLRFNPEQSVYSEYYLDRGLYTPLDQLIEGYEGHSGRAVPIERFRSDNRLFTARQLPVRLVNTLYESPGAWDTSTQGSATWSSGVLLKVDGDLPIQKYTQMTGKGSYFEMDEVNTMGHGAVKTYSPVMRCLGTVTNNNTDDSWWLVQASQNSPDGGTLDYTTDKNNWQLNATSGS